MFKALEKVTRSYERYMTYKGRVLAREQLLRYDDRMLADSGFSRELLEKGVSGWPWLTETEQQGSLSADTLHTSQRQATTDLKTLSDAELRDMGITRDTIEQAGVSGQESSPSDHQLKVA